MFNHVSYKDPEGLLGRVKDSLETVCWTLRKEPIWGDGLGDRICCSDFTEQQGVEPAIRHKAFAGKALIIPRVVLKNNSYHLNQTTQVLYGD